jgi:hypothetical protein
MHMCVSEKRWKEKTIEAAISVMWLIRIMRSAANIALRLPSRECPECKGETELVVFPEGLCGECWSRRRFRQGR